MNRQRRNVSTIASFDTGTIQSNDIEDNGLIKEGLLFYEGEHKCNKGNQWVVSPEDLMEIADNTNELLKEQRIGVFLEHKDTADNHVGFIKGELICRPIDEFDVEKKPELKSLEGRYALFCEEVQIKDRNIIQKIQDGLSKAVSCTINFKDNIMQSLSLVGKPALPYAAMFNQEHIAGISYKEALKQLQNRNDMTAERHKKFDVLCNVLENIRDMEESLLQDKNKEDLYSSVLGEFGEDLLKDLDCIDNQGVTTNTSTGFSLAEIEASLANFRLSKSPKRRR